MESQAMSNNTALQQQQKNPITSIRKFLDVNRQSFAVALPRHIKVDQFLRVALTAFQKNADLLKCTSNSVIGCLMESAQLGLQLDGILGEAYLVPFNNKRKDGRGYQKECQLIVGYKGYMKLGRNSGDVQSFYARAVFRDDSFEYEDGTSPIIRHKRSEKPPVFQKGEKMEDIVRGAYAIATFKDGSKQGVWLWKWEIEQHRAASKAESGPWFTNYPEMCEKTAIRVLAKWLPQSPDLQRAAALEDLSDAGVDQDLGAVYDLPPDSVVGDFDNEEPSGSQQSSAKTQADLDKLAEQARGRKPQPEGSAGTAQTSGQTAGNAQQPAGDKAPAAETKASPGDNPNYAVGSDPDPALERNLFAGRKGGQ
jgi:recombination protein RecT